MEFRSDKSGSENCNRSIRVHSVLYNLPQKSIARALDFLAASVRLARSHGLVGNVEVAYGDCSPAPLLQDHNLSELRRLHIDAFKIEYTFFNGNLGSAAGHNRLLAQAASDFVLILNPDVLTSPRLLIELLTPLRSPDVGFIEGRQLPIEHHKEYDQITGETSWGSTACLLGEYSLFNQLGGFDASTFFLYCDDVDLSWRSRLIGKKVIYRPQAVIYHDKRLDREGRWATSEAEKYYSAEAGLLLPYKYSRNDLTEEYLAFFDKSSDVNLHKAADNFRRRQSEGKLPPQIDPQHTVGQFIEGAYALSRFMPR